MVVFSGRGEEEELPRLGGVTWSSRSLRKLVRRGFGLTLTGLAECRVRPGLGSRRPSRTVFNLELFKIKIQSSLSSQGRHDDPVALPSLPGLAAFISQDRYVLDEPLEATLA